MQFSVHNNRALVNCYNRQLQLLWDFRPLRRWIKKSFLLWYASLHGKMYQLFASVFRVEVWDSKLHRKISTCLINQTGSHSTKTWIRQSHTSFVFNRTKNIFAREQDKGILLYDATLSPSKISPNYTWLFRVPKLVRSVIVWRLCTNYCVHRETNCIK
jgi:hypothetical protein